MTAVIVVYDASMTSETRRRPLEATQPTQKYQIEAINWGKTVKMCRIHDFSTEMGWLHHMSISYNNIISVTHRIKKPCTTRYRQRQPLRREKFNFCCFCPCLQTP